MGVVQLRQIKSHLEAHYLPHVDLQDYSTRPDADKANAGLTRALAAFALADCADLNPTTAGKAIIDGYNDNGIDGLLYVASDRVLYICQSKWSNDGTGSIDQAAAEKFARGVNDLLALQLDRFNVKVNARRAEIEAAVNNTVRIELITAHSGSEKLGIHPQRSLHDLLDQVNDTGEVATLTVLGQPQLYQIISQGGRGEPVNITVQLFDWGQTKSPYLSFYGQVAASDVSDWGAKYRQRIFSKNIRQFLGGATSVNESIAESVRRAPAHFWYLNNGITALCGSIRKRPIGGASHDAGTFDCEDVAVVNGAQTVGTISELAESARQQLAAARVPIRLISLEGCPPEFAMEVTRATNTQNRVDSRNFVALDPEQDRLRAELLIDGVDYEYRQGEGEPVGDAKFGLIDATVALACAQGGVDLAVQAKREISKLWEDLSRPPYKTMFNSGLTGLRLWHLVKTFRAIDRCMEMERSDFANAKRRNIAIHGNRFIPHLVMRRMDLKRAGHPDFTLNEISPSTEVVCSAVRMVIEDNYEDAYLASLFKNASKCRDIAGRVENLLRVNLMTAVGTDGAE